LSNVFKNTLELYSCSNLQRASRKSNCKAAAKTDVSDPLPDLSPRGSSCRSASNKLTLYQFPKAVIMIYLRHKRIYLQRQRKPITLAR